MMYSAVPLLDSNWELLSLREKNHRLYIHLILMAKKCTWSELSMPEKLALVDPEDYAGHRMQIQAICTARLRRNVDKVPYGPTQSGEICGLGFPGELWRPLAKWSIIKHPSKEYRCDLDWTRLVMELKNPAADLNVRNWVTKFALKYVKLSKYPCCGCKAVYGSRGRQEVLVDETKVTLPGTWDKMTCVVEILRPDGKWDAIPYEVIPPDIRMVLESQILMDLNEGHTRNLPGG